MLELIDGTGGISRHFSEKPAHVRRCGGHSTLRCTLLYTAVQLNCPSADYARAGFSDISLEMPGKRQEMPPAPSINANINSAVDTIHIHVFSCQYLASSVMYFMKQLLSCKSFQETTEQLS